jgi:hypothetical protein
LSYETLRGRLLGNEVIKVRERRVEFSRTSLDLRDDDEVVE